MTRKIIIDTDPGGDDILAMLLALSASAEELEVLLVSLTFGNIDVENCLRNAVTMFHVVASEMKWRESQGFKIGFESLQKCKPIIAVGATEPLEDQMMLADYFHGVDGLGDVHNLAPHHTPKEAWRHLFATSPTASDEDPPAHTHPFTPSNTPAHLETLRILRENPPDTITIVAIGPMTNLALAAKEDPETFLRVKEVVIMGGAIDYEGNVTPLAEFNTFADAVAAARVFALTSPTPSSTTPPGKMGVYPESLSKRLKLCMFPLDITTMHLLTEILSDSILVPLKEKGSPLAEWVSVFLHSAFRKMESLHIGVESNAAGEEVKRSQDVDMSMHDPLTIWYMMTYDSPGWVDIKDRDIRVEPVGQWTRGVTMVDRRTRKKAEVGEEEVVGDCGSWLHPKTGNRVRQMVKSPDMEGFGKFMLDRIFAL